MLRGYDVTSKFHTLNQRQKDIQQIKCTSLYWIGLNKWQLHSIHSKFKCHLVSGNKVLCMFPSVSQTKFYPTSVLPLHNTHRLKSLQCMDVHQKPKPITDRLPVTPPPTNISYYFVSVCTCRCMHTSPLFKSNNILSFWLQSGFGRDC